MYPVSTDYKTQIRNTLRNPSYIRVYFNITDPDASTDMTATDNGHIYYSDLDSTVFGYDIEESYNTLEHNRFTLGGNNPMAVAEGGTYSYQGFIGDEISDIDGYWDTDPQITINFGGTYSFIGLTFDFDDFIGDYPRSMNITAFNGVSEVLNATVAPDKTQNWIYDTAIPTCDKIVVTILRSAVPYRRSRIRSILFGIKKLFTDENIESATWKRNMSLIGSKLPVNTFDFTIFDLDREYDSENPTGVYAYMEEEQPVIFQLGYELDDGSIEWVTCGNMKTTGEIKSESTAVIAKATFKTTDLLNRLNMIYKPSVYNGWGATLYDLAVDILTYADIPLDTLGNPYWNIDTSLQSYTTTAILPLLSVKALLQLIANAGMCELYTDRDGYITIAPHDATATGFAFTFADIFEAPTLKKYPLLQGVDSVVTSYVPDTTASELAKFEVAGATADLYEFSYEMAKDITSSLTTTSFTKITGITATASSQYSTSYTPAMSIDGNTANYWRSLNKTLPQYITYDLQAVKNVGKVNVMINVAGYVTETFDIQVSTNGTDYTTVYTDASVTVTGTSYTSFILPYIVSGRYVRLNMKTSAGTYFVVTEAEVYESNFYITGTPTYYSQLCQMVLTGTGTVTLNGKKIQKKTSGVSVEVNTNGDRLAITNDLISDRTHATAYATWIGEYNDRRNEYSIDDRGFPELDCGDDIKLDTIYTKVVDVSVESVEIDYNGTISGKTKLLIK